MENFFEFLVGLSVTIIVGFLSLIAIALFCGLIGSLMGGLFTLINATLGLIMFWVGCTAALITTIGFIRDTYLK